MQDDINRREWENPGNWSDTIVGFYFSKKDTRVWVPKRNPAMGWTVNLGHPKGAWCMLGIIVAAPVCLAAACAGRKK